MKTSRVVSLNGRRFGRLLVLCRAENLHNRVAWKCICNCGNIKTATSSDLKSGKVLSCGCLRKETAAKTGKSNTMHGMTKTRLWQIWSSMKQRCHNKNSPHYQNYGARGITVCDEWKQGFEAFGEWALSNGYQDNLTLDRIDNNLGYYPDNCRWATWKQQENNRRDTVMVVIGGLERTLTDWSEFSGIARATLSERIRNNWPEHELLIKPDFANKHRRGRNEQR